MDADLPQRAAVVRLSRMRRLERKLKALRRAKPGLAAPAPAARWSSTIRRALECPMQRSLDEVLSRVIREAGSWSAAQQRIRIEHGAAVVTLAAQIALRERGQRWLRGERPAWGSTRRG
jgi:hypothetical protein